MKIKALIILMFFVCGTALAQETDFATWNSAKLNYKLNKKWELGLEGQVRFDKNSSELKNYFGELTAGYNFTKHLGLSTGVRYNVKNDNEGKLQGNKYFIRYNADLLANYEANRFSFGHRLRYTNGNELDEIEKTQYLRLGTSVGYNIKNWKLDPEFTGEIFNNLESGFNEYRIGIGTDYKIKDFGKVGIGYRYQKEFNVTDPTITHVLRLKYAYTLKR